MEEGDFPTTHPSGRVPTLQNIVSTVNLGCKLNLNLIANKARNAEFNPNNFSTVVLRIKNPKTTAVVFASGMLICTGAKTVDQSKLATKKYSRFIRKLGFPVKFVGFRVRNMVASFDVGFQICLERFACSSHGAVSIFEPEIFPGLVYRMKCPEVVLLVFASGKVVISGAKRQEDIYAAFENMYQIILGFKR